MIHAAYIFVKCQTGTIAVLKRSLDFSETIHNSEVSFYCYGLFYDYGHMIHVVCIFAEYQSGAVTDHCFEVVT